MSKLIRITDEIYGKLTALKGKESYSSAIKCLLADRGNKDAILSFAGKGGIDMGEMRKLKDEWKLWSKKYAYSEEHKWLSKIVCVL
ncbi:hypothetical protein HYU14_05530 [Candidatus Woesearchaeota archaeon]|nr:hypothetical protein [Candidatus Woesearchaeota archaeon]